MSIYSAALQLTTAQLYYSIIDASEHGHPEHLAIFIDLYHQRGGSRPLMEAFHLAVDYSQVECIHLLLPHIDLNSPECDAWCLAARNDDLPVLKLALPLNPPPQLLYNALQEAADCSQTMGTDCLNHLIPLCLALDPKGEVIGDALMHATLLGGGSKVAALIEHPHPLGTDYQALGFALEQDHVNCCEIILNHLIHQAQHHNMPWLLLQEWIESWISTSSRLAPDCQSIMTSALEKTIFEQVSPTQSVTARKSL